MAMYLQIWRGLGAEELIQFVGGGPIEYVVELSVPTQVELRARPVHVEMVHAAVYEIHHVSLVRIHG